MVWVRWPTTTPWGLDPKPPQNCRWWPPWKRKVWLSGKPRKPRVDGRSGFSKLLSPSWNYNQISSLQIGNTSSNHWFSGANCLFQGGQMLRTTAFYSKCLWTVQIFIIFETAMIIYDSCITNSHLSCSPQIFPIIFFVYMACFYF